MKRTYIQQMHYDGTTYKKGPVVDLLSKFNICCKEFPFKRNPEAKDLPARDWPGVDGRDVYIPKNIPVKNYDLEVEFIYKGVEDNIVKNVSSFINFLYGKNPSAVGARLAIYDQHTRTGRKDVHVLSVDNDVYFCTEEDPDAVATFKVKFSVEDPTTEVTPKVINSGGAQIVSDLIFS